MKQCKDSLQILQVDGLDEHIKQSNQEHYQVFATALSKLRNLITIKLDLFSIDLFGLQVLQLTQLQKLKILGSSQVMYPAQCIEKARSQFSGVQKAELLWYYIKQLHLYHNIFSRTVCEMHCQSFFVSIEGADSLEGSLNTVGVRADEGQLSAMNTKFPTDLVQQSRYLERRLCFCKAHACIQSIGDSYYYSRKYRGVNHFCGHLTTQFAHDVVFVKKSLNGVDQVRIV